MFGSVVQTKKWEEEKGKGASVGISYHQLTDGMYDICQTMILRIIIIIIIIIIISECCASIVLRTDTRYHKLCYNTQFTNNPPLLPVPCHANGWRHACPNG